jgi:hypothetical protein
MNRKLLFVAMVISLFNLSLAHPQRSGLLTDDRGIVTSEDLNEEEKYNKCYPFEPAYDISQTPDDNCLNYWQCLSTDDVYINCDDVGDNGDFPHAGSADFWVKEGGITHHYMTRRDFSLDSCQRWVTEWKEVMRGEDVVCLSGDFLLRKDLPYGDTSSPAGSQYYWIIDRMKSNHAEWSYFFRDPTLFPNDKQSAR